jgi:hypothetical protein
VKQSGTENNPKRAYNFLKRLDPELARASMSLRTDEPVSSANPVPSMGSDAMLSRITNLPNDRFTKQKLKLRELVRTRIQTDPEALGVSTFALQNSGGEPEVHILLSVPKKLEELVVEGNDKQQQLGAQVNVLVRSKNGEKLFQQNHKQLFTFTPVQFSAEKDRIVAYADQLPLPPGEYDVDFSFQDTGHGVYYLAQEKITVPDRSPTLSLGPLVPYEEIYRADSTTSTPFSLFNLRFVPTTKRDFALGEELKVFFQVSVPPGDLQGNSEGKINISYTVGSLSTRTRQTLEDNIPKSEFDGTGVVLHGKTIPLRELAPGNYRLVVNVTDPQTKKSADRTFAFRLMHDETALAAIVLYNGQLERDLRAGWFDYRRGQVEAAQGKVDAAIRHFTAVLERNPRHENARNRLVQIYFSQQRHQEVISLLDPLGITVDTDLDTVTSFLVSMKEQGKIVEAIELGKQALMVLGPELPLYEGLADLYEMSGQTVEAAKAREQAQQLREALVRKE